MKDLVVLFRALCPSLFDSLSLFPVEVDWTRMLMKLISQKVFMQSEASFSFCLLWTVKVLEAANATSAPCFASCKALSLLK